MSPVSRGRGKKARKQQKQSHGDLVAELLQPFKAQTLSTDALGVELSAAHLIGLLAQSAEESVEEFDASVLGLIEASTARARPESLGLALAFARLGVSPEQREVASTAAGELIGRGIEPPRWADRLEGLTLGDCWLAEDVFGDTATVFCTFAYGDETHGVGAMLLYPGAEDSGVHDGFVTDAVDDFLVELTDQVEQDTPIQTLRRISAQEAADVLLPALDETDVTWAHEIGEDFGELAALIYQRAGLLPEAEPRPEPEPVAEADRAAVAAEFLAEHELPEATEQLALIMDFACATTGSPTHVSPQRVVEFLLDWLPDHGRDDEAFTDTMATTVTRWLPWAARRNGLPSPAIVELVDVGAEAVLDYTNNTG